MKQLRLAIPRIYKGKYPARALACLTESKGEIVSLLTLSGYLFDENGGPADELGVVRAAIASLRRYGKKIETVRGKGYRLL